MAKRDSTYDALLARALTPGQYVDGEWNAAAKPPETIGCRLALAFPDAYSLGMSHHGLRILYELANGIDGVAAERVFQPLPDMEALLREAGRPLATLESQTPLDRCDLVGFTLPYELTAANLLAMLELGRIPPRACDRSEAHPLVIAGGAGAANPEPLADVLDLVLLGDGEEALPEFLAAFRRLKEEDLPRRERIRRLAAGLPGWYAPGLYEERDGRLRPAAEGIPGRVARRVVRNLDTAPHPRRPVVPVVETTHERVTLEVLRGCPWGCRFCQAGATGRPFRWRRTETLLDLARANCAATGYDEIGLLSLSTSDHPDFANLVETLDREFAPRGVGLSLPSLRVNAALRGVPERVASVRKAAFTIAPEAATERLRAVINKHVTDEDLLEGSRAAFAQGWRSVKLYFMVGLPTETEEDVRAIPALARQVASLRRGGRGPAVSLAIGNFVPKPHTPFQWEAMDRPETLRRKHALILDAVDRHRVSCQCHGVETSLLEAALSRGDRRLGPVLLDAFRRGARLCAWREHFRFDLWTEAFARHGLDPAELACAPRDPGQPLPWEHLGGGTDPAFLLRERERSREGLRTPPCAPGACQRCGATACSLTGNGKEA